MVAKIHNIKLHIRATRKELPHLFEQHDCLSCNLYTSVFKITKKHHEYEKECQQNNRESKKAATQKPDTYSVTEVEVSEPFSPKPLSPQLSHKIISGFCKNASMDSLEEGGCAMCGRLTPEKQLTKLKSIVKQLHILELEGGTRNDRRKLADKIESGTRPIIDHTCDQVCEGCRREIHLGKVPHCALANGLWIGDVPQELQDLHYIEKLLVQKVWVNGCFVCVASSGQRKIVAHAIAFESLVAKVYNILPPPVEDLDEVLAVLFTGPCKPTGE